MTFCEQCGAEISDGAKFCKNCGAKVESGVSETIHDNSGERIQPSNERENPVISHAEPEVSQTKVQYEEKRSYEPEPQRAYETPPVVHNTAPAGTPPGVDLRNPLIAAVASFFFPGLGQTYAGEQKRGIIFLAGTLVIGYFLGIVMVIPMLWATYDAYKLSKMVNSGEKEFIAPSIKNYVIFFGLWIVIIILLGVVDLALYGDRMYYSGSDYDFVNPMSSETRF